MSEKTIKLTALILFDLLIIMVPLLVTISPEIVKGVGIGMSVLITISLLVILFPNEAIDVYNTLLEEAKEKPKWWDIYDVITDVAFIISWLYIDYIILVMLFVIMKLAIARKFPEYYIERGKQ